jgi:hypothetical protein
MSYATTWSESQFHASGVRARPCAFLRATSSFQLLKLFFLQLAVRLRATMVATSA